MKSFIPLFLVLCWSLNLSSQNYDPGVDSLLNQVNQDSLVSCVRILSGEDSVYINGQNELIKQRVYNTNGLAEDYLFEKLSSYGLSTERINYAPNGTNIVAIQEGETYADEFYMICAHYDGVTTYCADDNASGTAAVIEAARLLTKMELPYSVIYALWDEEEIGLIGSKDYANDTELDIRGVINIDMIGWDGDDDGLVEIHTKNISSSPEITNIMIEVNDLYELNLDPDVQNPGASASDHSSFWNIDVGAILLIEAYYNGDFNPYYHSPQDRISLFNLPYFHSASKLAIGTLTELAYGEQTVGSNELVNAENELKLVCYPNPACTATTIKYSIKHTQNINISLINNMGQVIYANDGQFVSEGTNYHEIDISNYPAGIYTLLLYSKTEIASRPIVISR